MINIKVFFIEEYKGWTEDEAVFFNNFNSLLSEISLKKGEKIINVPLDEIIRENSIFYRVLFEDGYLNYFPIDNNYIFFNDLRTLIRVSNNSK